MYIKREDAIRAVSGVDDYGDGIGFEIRSHCLVELSLLPSADVVECGECKHLGYCSRSVKVVSPLLGEYDEDKAIRYHLEFCSFGERKDNE